MNKPAPKVERLLEVLELRSDGSLCWRVRTSNRVAIGQVAGTVGNHGYMAIRVDGSLQLAHRIVGAMTHGEWPKGHIDHINCIRTDNRPENLRIANRTQQIANVGRRSDNTTGFKGVTWCKRAGKFIAQIHHDGKHRHLGTFDSAETAHKRYVAEAARVFGEFARAA